MTQRTTNHVHVKGIFNYGIEKQDLSMVVSLMFKNQKVMFQNFLGHNRTLRCASPFFCAVLWAKSKPKRTIHHKLDGLELWVC